MIIAYLGLGVILFSGVVLVGLKLLKQQPKKPLRVGDYVMFKSKYKNLFPQVPTSHALVIEKIFDNEAVVVFMTLNAITRETMPLYVLARAS